ncbi:MAG: hypothetical protein OEV28_05695 [Nitrospirota bacterium]|nr:hypothetical protein [Nitrospirota bacterium]
MTADGLRAFYQNRFRVVVAGVIALLTVLAWINRFIQDDAFISFRYAENLVNGHGLVWNPGERVEGYTNFLWTLLMAIPIALGYDPVPFSLGLGMACFAVTLGLTYLLASSILGSKNLGILTILLLGTNYTFSAYATGGLETQMQACLFVACACVVTRAVRSRIWTIGKSLSLSLLCAAALLIRLDSSILVIVLLGASSYSILSENASVRTKQFLMLSLAAPLVIIVGGWLLWKLAFYGSILPNTFYSKVSGAASIERGFYYFYVFLKTYWLIPMPFLAIWVLWKMQAPWKHPAAILAAIVALWFLYMIRVGGDFMEFRFVVPVMPFFFILLVMMIAELTTSRPVQALLVVVIIMGSLWHAMTYTGYVSVKYRGIESIEELNNHVTSKGQNWSHVGRLLGEAFHYRPDVVIATTAAGAIPYYSRLATVDMLGLSDSRIAREGVVVGDVPGHTKIARFSYLRERKVNLLIGPPWFRGVDESLDQPYTLNSTRNFTIMTEHDRIPYDSMLIEIPVDPKWVLTVLYLTRHPFIDDVIRQQGWKVWPVTQLSR